MENKINNNFDLTVVLPIKSAVVPFFDDYFTKCIKSIKNQEIHPIELIIVHTPESSLVEILNNYDFEGLQVRKIEWDLEPNFCEQVNLGVSESNTKWVSVLEFDDEYSKIWFKNAKKYSEVYTDTDVFLPIVVDVDDKTVFAGFTNEATFAANFSSEMGILTNETLLTYQNFQTSGMVIKKDTFIDFGGFKPSIKLTFVYELLLRLTYNSVKIMSIPKLGYKHINLRNGSIFWNYKNGESKMSEDEIKFWIQSAKKEYFFVEDRNIKYEPSEV
jgi:hypothetical protein